MRFASVRARVAGVLTLLVAAVGLVVAAPAAAAPSAAAGDDGEGGSASLVRQLEAASRGFMEAEEALARSTKRQRELTAQVNRLEAELGPRQAAFDEIVQHSYRSGRLGPMSALITASSAGSFLDRADTLVTVAVKEHAVLTELIATRDEQRRARVAIDAAVREQRKQVNVMARRKAQAEAALKAANAGGDDDPRPGDGSGSGYGDGKAEPAPRNPDGSLPGEGCIVNDPTTSGCLTPRTLHALRQAKKDGFRRFVSCFREQSTGEHPKGRACDFAADKGGFGGVATGDSRSYGNRLAAYFIANSRRLGVLYVIWFRRIWLPSSGWKSYSRGRGDPSSDHTNHVHLSER